jgi:hypothetical protein
MTGSMEEVAATTEMSKQQEQRWTARLSDIATRAGGVRRRSRQNGSSNVVAPVAEGMTSGRWTMDDRGGQRVLKLALYFIVAQPD